MLVYSSGCAILWTIAWFMMAERRAPGSENIQKRWLPPNIGPAFYSIALSVFFGIFGYLVSRLHCFSLPRAYLSGPILLHYDIYARSNPYSRPQVYPGRGSAGCDEYVRYVHPTPSNWHVVTVERRWSRPRVHLSFPKYQ